MRNAKKIEDCLQACADWGLIPTSFRQCMTWEEQVLWLAKFLQETVIPTVNENTQSFNELQAFVDNYFDNLDVQEEINNKLDEMAESGTLADIISQYLNSTAIFGYNNVASMKAAENLVDGSFARTMGYYLKNDGGGALYKIRTITNDDVVDNAYIIEMADDTLVGELIIENNSVNLRQLGGATTADISTQIAKYMAHNSDKHKLYIPAGEWMCDEIELSTWFDISGDSKFVGKTIIRPAIEEQAYIIKISSDNGYGWSLSGLHFETGKEKALTDSVIWLNNTSYGQMKDITFQNVVGQCIRNVGSFEINFYNTIARGCYPQALGDNTGLFSFKSSTGRTPSTLYFDYIQCEQIFGNIFFVNSDTLVANNKIGSINIEQPIKSAGQSEMRDIVAGLTLTSVLDESDTSIAAIGSYKHHAIITQTTSSQVAGLTIDSIDYNNAASCVWNLNGSKYIFDCCIQKSSSQENTNINFSGKIGNSTMLGLQKDFYLVNTRNRAVCRCSDTKNNIIFGDVEYAETGSNKCVFAVHSEYNIKAGNIARPNDTSANTEGFIECNTLTAPIETYYGITCGCQEYRDNAISKGMMVLRPKTTMSDGGGFKAIAGGNKLLIRYASTATTNIIVRDLDRSDNQNQITVDNTNGNFVWVTFDLGTNITNYALGDNLRIGASSGAVSFDVLKFI